jgi:hypothetical protein
MAQVLVRPTNLMKTKLPTYPNLKAVVLPESFANECELVYSVGPHSRGRDRP